jgi:preprotein translocase subunit SecA
MRDLERFLLLQVVDLRWREHLENMDYLREGIHLRSMAQKDPLVEYRNEGHLMFQELNRQIRAEVIHNLYHTRLEVDQGDGGAGPGGPLGGGGNGNGGGPLSYEHQTLQGAEAMLAAGGTSPASATAAIAGGGSIATPLQRPVVNADHENIGRNDPCWCGSGKKYKRCHGA